MSGKIFLLVFIILAAVSAKAQTADEVYNQYLDFNLARLQGEQDKVSGLGEKLRPNAEKLPEKARTNFYFSIGKIYEDNSQPQKAKVYYEKVAAAAPDYYVVHRALGYIYLDDVRAIEKKLNASVHDQALNAQLAKDYSNAVKRALPHLEKAQACDPSDETLAIIKLLYKNIHDPRGALTLDSRLKEMNKNCIDILSDR
ncbi:MAG: hypothetical protein NVSMB24_17040 [Mucilaginibacter sp.]